MKNTDSFFRKVIEEFYGFTDFEQAKDFITKFIESSKINKNSKAKMLKLDIPRITNLPQLQQYVTNSMFKFEA